MLKPALVEAALLEATLIAAAEETGAKDKAPEALGAKEEMTMEVNGIELAATLRLVMVAL